MKPVLWIIVGALLALGGAGLIRWMRTPSTSAGYSPSPSEVPIHQDYDGAAEKMVRPDNYKAQLSKIEKDLIDLSRREEN